MLKLNKFYLMSKNHIVELLILMKWNFKINFKHKSTPIAMGNSVILRKIYVKEDQE